MYICNNDASIMKRYRPKQNTNPPVPTPVPSSVKNGMYVNGFTTTLPDNSLRTALKNFIVAKKFNFLIFYMGSLLDNSTNRGLMRTFLSGLTVDKKGVNVTQSANAINTSDAGTPAAYNVGCTNASEKFNLFVQEGEFWHENNYFASFEAYKTNSLLIYNYCQANNITYDAYVSKCEDVANVAIPSEIAYWLVQHSDTIHLVNYINVAKFNKYSGLSDGIKEQIQLYANAAYLAGKTQKINILWASEGNYVNGVATNMRDYFVANPTLLPAYETFKTAYDGWSFTNKSNISITGQNNYGYNGIKDL